MKYGTSTTNSTGQCAPPGFGPEGHNEPFQHWSSWNLLLQQCWIKYSHDMVMNTELQWRVNRSISSIIQVHPCSQVRIMPMIRNSPWQFSHKNWKLMFSKQHWDTNERSLELQALMRAFPGHWQREVCCEWYLFASAAANCGWCKWGSWGDGHKPRALCGLVARHLQHCIDLSQKDSWVFLPGKTQFCLMNHSCNIWIWLQ